MSDFECPKCKNEVTCYGDPMEEAGEQKCDECGFLYHVAVEYDPSYEVTCVEHDMGEPVKCKAANGETYLVEKCKLCGDSSAEPIEEEEC